MKQAFKHFLNFAYFSIKRSTIEKPEASKKTFVEKQKKLLEIGNKSFNSGFWNMK